MKRGTVELSMTVIPDLHYCQAMAGNLPYALLNAKDEILFISLPARPYFIRRDGAAGHAVLAVIDPALQSELVATLARARQTGMMARSDPVKNSDAGAHIWISAQSLAGDDIGAGAMILMFDELTQADPGNYASDQISSQSVISDLYAELMLSRDEFHRLAIAHEETVGNMAALNEELHSNNEELRSASSELQANRDTLEAGNAALTEMVNRITKSNTDLENFAAATELALIFLDSDLRIIRYTSPATGVFELMPEHLGRRLPDIAHNLQYGDIENDIRAALRQHRIEREVSSSAGSWYSLRIVPFRSQADQTTGVVLTLIDISIRKGAEENLRTGEQRWRLALEAAGDGIWDWNVMSNKSSLSPAWRRILGYDTDELTSETPDEWEALIHPEDRPGMLENIRACARGEQGWFSHEYRIRCKDGHWKWVLSRGAVVERDQRGRASRVIGTLSDISQKKMAEHEIWYRANYDHLTALPNRSFFLERLEYEVVQSRRAVQPFAVMFIDLDRFKEVNDLHGHSAGDLLLRIVADELKSSVRESDTVARLGGDEFTVILPSLTDPIQVELIAEEILRKLSAPIQLAGNVVHISASVGVTFFPRDAGTSGDLVRNADQAMYVAKNAGRNCCRFFSQDMQDDAITRISITNDLHHAIDGQLKLCFQPIIDMRTGEIVKAEALLRWSHPTRGLIQPDKFIHLAEEAGLIGRIGDWVFTEAAGAALRLGKLLGRPFQISINKSPLELTPSDNLARLDWIAFLDRMGLDTRSIVIEITEGLLLHASARVTDRISSLRRAGIQFALDDFGTGYSSMSYLTNYNVDFLKIDQSFISSSEGGTASAAIAETMIILAHKLGLKVIAEGVERPEQHEWLRAAGCDYSQGFLYSEPLELDAFEEMVLESQLQGIPRPDSAEAAAIDLVRGADTPE
jgi:diguanylate cyclase (GGDEF)-like protein/PAS domain S-box-containing protein